MYFTIILQLLEIFEVLEILFCVLNTAFWGKCLLCFVSFICVFMLRDGWINKVDIKQYYILDSTLSRQCLQKSLLNYSSNNRSCLKTNLWSNMLIWIIIERKGEKLSHFTGDGRVKADFHWLDTVMALCHMLPGCESRLYCDTLLLCPRLTFAGALLFVQNVSVLRILVHNCSMFSTSSPRKHWTEYEQELTPG